MTTRTAERQRPFDPTDPNIQADLYSHYAWLREHSPVHYVEKLDEYIVTRHQDLYTILTSPAIFSNERAIRTSPLAAIPMLPTADDPLHAVQRRLIQRAFTPNAIRQLRAYVGATAERLVDRIVEQGSVDLIAGFAYPFPMEVLAYMCGTGADDANFRAWADALFAATSNAGDAAIEAAMVAIMEFGEYILGKAGERRTAFNSGAELPSDILTALATPNEDGESLPDGDLVIAAAMMLSAGHETTTKLIGNTIHLLLTNPEQRRLLEADPDLLESAIEESLRFESPAQGVWRRVAVETTLGGVRLPQDAIIFMAFGSANRDPAVFKEPDRFDIRRDTMESRRHLSFGHGMHVCVGSYLARLEAMVAVRTILSRLPNLRLDEAKTPVRSPLHWMRGWEVLPVQWDH